MDEDPTLFRLGMASFLRLYDFDLLDIRRVDGNLTITAKTK